MRKHNTHESAPLHCFGKEKKPIEIYIFIDPLCPECWALEPVIKKLQIEYGRYFTVRHILSGNLAMINLTTRQKQANIAELWEKTASRTGMSCDGTLWLENPISSPHIVSIAIKAAELQGQKAGLRFLRRIREMLFLDKQNISELNVLKQCAHISGLDVGEFEADILSESAAKAFQCDLKITSEMEVQEIPSLVFFNENIEDEGIKISGVYSYDIYEQILTEMLPFKPEKTPPPPIYEFLKFFGLVATKEIAVVYNMTVNEVEKEMKKLLLKQVVERIPAKYGVFWKFKEKNNE